MAAAAAAAAAGGRYPTPAVIKQFSDISVVW